MTYLEQRYAPIIFLAFFVCMLVLIGMFLMLGWMVIVQEAESLVDEAACLTEDPGTYANPKWRVFCSEQDLSGYEEAFDCQELLWDYLSEGENTEEGIPANATGLSHECLTEVPKPLPEMR